jgi:hypothetical protein
LLIEREKKGCYFLLDSAYLGNLIFFCATLEDLVVVQGAFKFGVANAPLINFISSLSEDVVESFDFLCEQGNSKSYIEWLSILFT